MGASFPSVHLKCDENMMISLLTVLHRDTRLQVGPEEPLGLQVISRLERGVPLMKMDALEGGIEPH